MNTLIRTLALGMFGIALAAAPLNVSLNSGIATQDAAAKNGADNGGGDDRGGNSGSGGGHGGSGRGGADDGSGHK